MKKFDELRATIVGEGDIEYDLEVWTTKCYGEPRGVFKVKFVGARQTAPALAFDPEEIRAKQLEITAHGQSPV